MSYYEIREEENSLDTSLIMRSAYSLKDDGYVGTEEKAKFLCDEKEIEPERISPDHDVCSIGFCEKEQKWYGWSHRAIYGFSIGSEVKKGDLAYVADTPEGLIDYREEFFGDISDECGKQHRDECQILPDRSGIRILITPIKLPMAHSAQELMDAITDDTIELEEEYIFKDDVIIQKCGRGEWKAKTLENAKQMAKDFAEGVA